MKTLINRRWELELPDHRSERPGWEWWERERLAMARAMIRPDDYVWEIGAEEGDHAALFASWGAELIVVEPSPEAWPWIRWTFEHNALKTPIVNFVGFCGLTSSVPAEMFGDRTIRELMVVGRMWPDESYELDMVPEHGFRHLNEQTDVTPVLALDDAGSWPADVLSIDVEGAELEVLLGGREFLLQRRPRLLISVHPQFMWDRYKRTRDDLLVYLRHHLNYECEQIALDHEEHWLAVPR